MEQIFARTNRHAFHPNKLPIKGYGVAAIGNQRGDTARLHVIKRIRLKTARSQTNERPACRKRRIASRALSGMVCVKGAARVPS